MNVSPGWWRRWAVKLAQHTSWVLPGAQSPWAEAMRRELDYIEDDAAALRWALGCVVAGYRARLAHGLCFGARAWRHVEPRLAHGLCFGARAWRHVESGALVLSIGLALLENAGGQTQSQRPVFNETTCDLPNISPDLRPRLRCGTVSVPRDYDNPDAGHFNLAVVVIKSEQQPSWPEPVVYISGGPGYPLTVYAAYQARTPYAPRRDLVLVDQRGTGRSEPNICPDLDRKLLDATLAIAATVTEEALARRQATYLACRDEAVGRGLDLRDFGTRVTVEDFERVRQALRVERWNVYGESYGTTVAMTLAALYPDTVRSAVLDSVYPPDPVPLWSTIVGDARDAFFAHCARDKGCSTSFPDLAETYRDTLVRLDQNPLVVTLPPQMQQADDRVRITASLFEVGISNLLYYSNSYPTLPRIIQSVHDGDAPGVETVLGSQLAAAAILNRATHAAVECRDRPHFRTQLAVTASALDRTQLYGVCGDWSALGPWPLVPVGTRVPTLVLAGQFDPVARPASSRHVAGLIGDSARFIEFPLIGHSVRQSSPCGARIAADFIDRPAQAPDISCADRIAPIRFLPKRQTP
jgi:pimeloyl-ACP methyl ester carboxylesterase